MLSNSGRVTVRGVPAAYLAGRRSLASLSAPARLAVGRAGSDSVVFLGRAGSGLILVRRRAYAVPAVNHRSAL